MYRRHTKAERHADKVRIFEIRHPKNKYVMRRQAERAWQRAVAQRVFSECLANMAAEGNQAARMMLFAMSITGGNYLY